jgi:hypothetical protein
MRRNPARGIWHLSCFTGDARPRRARFRERFYSAFKRAVQDEEEKEMFPEARRSLGKDVAYLRLEIEAMKERIS